MPENSVVVETQMLIRRPASDVFNAFIDPEVTRNFWFTKGSEKLSVGKTITWEWEMYNVSTTVKVIDIIPAEKISVEWNEPPTKVDFEFRSLEDGATYVTIKNYGFTETGDTLLKMLIDLTGGFTTVLDGAKAYLEHGINLNLIADKFPKEVIKHGN